jgi:ABC-type uncharacterized transport system permease subunit
VALRFYAISKIQGILTYNSAPYWAMTLPRYGSSERLGKHLVQEVFSETQAVGSPRTSPCDSQSYDASKVRFSATLGEEPEVEVAMV